MGTTKGRLSRILPHKSIYIIPINSAGKSIKTNFDNIFTYMLTRYSSSIFSLNSFAVFASRISRQTTWQSSGSLILNCKTRWNCELMDRNSQKMKLLFNYVILTTYGEFSIRSPRSTSPRFSLLSTMLSG